MKRRAKQLVRALDPALLQAASTQRWRLAEVGGKLSRITTADKRHVVADGVSEEVAALLHELHNGSFEALERLKATNIELVKARDLAWASRTKWLAFSYHAAQQIGVPARISAVEGEPEWRNVTFLLDGTPVSEPFEASLLHLFGGEDASGPHLHLIR